MNDEAAKVPTTATVNGITYETIVDTQGTQRFRANRIVRDLLDDAAMSLNTIASRVNREQYSEDEQRELYRLIGYSVCGYADVFEDDKVDSSLWTKK